MVNIDYDEVGFMCGLEVHQQLLTAEKTFCRCPAGLYTEEHDGEVLRHMRPTLSELGVYDGTALMEFKTKKEIIYLLHTSNTCTYEMDDTPPFLMNQRALDVAIEVCLTMNCDIIDEVHIARKQYLDGSIPTGFQRTAIVGVNGWIPFRNRKLGIIQVSFEEDSCREVSDQGHRIIWRTDRLGMPLIETVTEPTLKRPDEVVEAILILGRVARSTRHVRTGIGASRQDVNVSVRGGRRVEIKGVPRAKYAAMLVHNEAVRQVQLLKLRDELHKRGIKRDEDVKMTSVDVTRIFRDTYHDILRRAIERGNIVRAVKIEGAGGTPGWPCQEDYNFAFEISGRVRVIACLDEAPIVLHSDNWPEYRGGVADRKLVENALKVGANDAWFVVWGSVEDTLTAAKEIRLRYVDATDGIPHETRQPFPDGHTDFERILPGADRMYPDTDSPPCPVTLQRVQELKDALAPPPWEREAQYRKYGLPESTIHWLIRYGNSDILDDVIDAGCDGRLAGFWLGERYRALKRAGVQLTNLTSKHWKEIFTAVKSGKFLPEGIYEVVCSWAKQPELPFAELLGSIKMSKLDSVKLDLSKDNLGWHLNIANDLLTLQGYLGKKHDSAERRIKWLMMQVMPRMRGRVEASKVHNLLEQVVQSQWKAGEFFEMIASSAKKVINKIKSELKDE